MNRVSLRLFSKWNTSTIWSKMTLFLLLHISVFQSLVQYQFRCFLRNEKNTPWKEWIAGVSDEHVATIRAWQEANGQHWPDRAAAAANEQTFYIQNKASLTTKFVTNENHRFLPTVRTISQHRQDTSYKYTCLCWTMHGAQFWYTNHIRITNWMFTICAKWAWQCLLPIHPRTCGNERQAAQEKTSYVSLVVVVVVDVVVVAWLRPDTRSQHFLLLYFRYCKRNGLATSSHPLNAWH